MPKATLISKGDLKNQALFEPIIGIIVSSPPRSHKYTIFVYTQNSIVHRLNSVEPKELPAIIADLKNLRYTNNFELRFDCMAISTSLKDAVKLYMEALGQIIGKIVISEITWDKSQAENLLAQQFFSSISHAIISANDITLANISDVPWNAIGPLLAAGKAEKLLLKFSPNQLPEPSLKRLLGCIIDIECPPDLSVILEGISNYTDRSIAISLLTIASKRRQIISEKAQTIEARVNRAQNDIRELNAQIESTEQRLAELMSQRNTRIAELAALEQESLPPPILPSGGPSAESHKQDETPGGDLITFKTPPRKRAHAKTT